MLRSRRGSVVTTFVCALAGAPLLSCAPAPPPVYPPWSAQATAVKVYFADDKPDCEELLSVGNVEAVSRVPESKKSSEQKATLDSALSWLRHEVAARQANVVRVLTHGPNEDGSAYLITGEAFHCRGPR